MSKFENIVAKGETAHYEQVLFFVAMLSNGVCCRYIRISASWEMLMNICSFYKLPCRSWHNSSEHRNLLDALVEVVASSAKLLIVAVNMANYHSLEYVYLSQS